jgi:hypothetical protein
MGSEVPGMSGRMHVRSHWNNRYRGLLLTEETASAAQFAVRVSRLQLQRRVRPFGSHLPGRCGGAKFGVGKMH